MKQTFPVTLVLSCRAKGLDWEETVFVRDLKEEDKAALKMSAETFLFNHLWHTIEDDE